MTSSLRNHELLLGQHSTDESLPEIFTDLLAFSQLIELYPEFNYFAPEYGLSSNVAQGEEVLLPHIPEPLFRELYSRLAADHLSNLYKMARKLKAAGKYNPKETAISELDPVGQQVLIWSFSLIESLKFVICSPILKPNTRGRIDQEVVNLALLADSVGAKKEPTFIETVRRYTPHWLTHAVPLKKLSLSGGTANTVAAWARYTEQEVDFLTSTNSAGDAIPLIRILCMAEKLEDKRERIEITVRAVIQILRTELEQAQLRNESPFFHLILAAHLQEPLPTPKNASFNLRQTLEDILHEMFTALGERAPETQKSTQETFLQRILTATGFASDNGSKIEPAFLIFLYQLQSSFDNNFAPLLASALSRFSIRAPEINCLKVVHALSAFDRELGRTVLLALQRTQAHRPVINNQEAALLLEVLPLPQLQNSEYGEIVALWWSVLHPDDDEDGIDVLSLSKKLSISGKTILIRTEIYDEEAEVQLTVKEQKKPTRSLFFRVIQQAEGILILPSSMLDIPTTEILAACELAFYEALYGEREKLEARKRKEHRRAQNRQTPPLKRAETTLPAAANSATRKQRIAAYQQQQQQQKEEDEKVVRTAPGSSQNHDRAPLSLSTESESAVTPQKVEIIDCDHLQVATHLQDSRIQIDARVVIDKIRQLARQAERSLINPGRLQGKFVSRHKHRLLQVTWDELKHSLRFYFQIVPGKPGVRTYRLVGILDKKGVEMQQRYIDTLITRVYPPQS